MASRTRYSWLLKPVQLVADIGLILSALIFTDTIFLAQEIALDQGISGKLILALLWVPIAIVFRPYSGSRTSSIYASLRKDLGLLVFCFILIFCAGLWFFKLHGSERLLLAAFVFASFGFMLWRVSFNMALKAYRKQGYNYRNVLIVGHGELAGQMKKYFTRNPEMGFRITAEFSEGSMQNQDSSIGSLEEIALNGQVHEIYCCLPDLSKEALHRIVRLGEETLIKIKLIGDLGQLYDHRLELEHYDHIPVLNVRRIPLDDPLNRIFKRAFDFVFTLVVCFFVLSWIIPLIAIFIKIGSKGPVFFRQRRTGRDGQEFWCLKFRTMVPGAESMPEPDQNRDTRITGIGALLRKSSLDELPQFFNVLIGDMSVVGPRPHMVAHSEEYTRIDRKFRARQSIKPGITGLAQAKGFRGVVRDRSSLKDRLKLDRFYLENWSLYFDLKIILLTMRSLIRA